ncbi:per-pentamer repeat gene-like protein [Cricetulus griseus]|uniref:Per-pentamer repeat gene-like protein n=1 Tax=Cricetulus griseus TaxID=10029 RepID=A0A061IQ24_CRIGR|nr:per-pentamer repeat gene-like protein [Cricetulus griseus]
MPSSGLLRCQPGSKDVFSGTLGLLALPPKALAPCGCLCAMKLTFLTQRHPASPHSILHHLTASCITPQHPASCITSQHPAPHHRIQHSLPLQSIQHPASLHSILHHLTASCITSQHPASCITSQHPASCITSQHPASCITSQHPALLYSILHHFTGWPGIEAAASVYTSWHCAPLHSVLHQCLTFNCSSFTIPSPLFLSRKTQRSALCVATELFHSQYSPFVILSNGSPLSLGETSP